MYNVLFVNFLKLLLSWNEKKLVAFESNSYQYKHGNFLTGSYQLNIRKDSCLFTVCFMLHFFFFLKKRTISFEIKDNNWSIMSSNDFIYQLERVLAMCLFVFFWVGWGGET
jgi:hypothetical protein